MAFLNREPSYTGSGTGLPVNGGAQRLALDNLLRRELKIGDPSDPNQVAQGLLARYKDDPRANAITQEARGLPFLLTAPAGASASGASTSSDAELQQARDDVERDLRELLGTALLKDVTPELQGWAQGVRTAIAEGSTAARFGLDPRQRDKVFSLRRQLGLYARMARTVGALTPNLSIYYRNLAQSIDEVSAILLVRVGESMASGSWGGNRFLLQIPYGELQSRRDAAVNALRNLAGIAPEAFSQNTYSWGIHDYRNLLSALESRGQGDLRILLDEAELSRMMDEVIQRAARGSVEGLRQLGVTAQLDLERIYRLLAIGNDLQATLNSPPLTSFLDTLGLFVESFNPAGGFRLLRIARPAILFYGLYGMGGMDRADQRILQLTILRTLLATELDNFLGCECDQNAVLLQVLLDKVLCDLDRAIDLYAVGHEDFGAPEQRAAAYGYVIAALGLYMGYQVGGAPGKGQDFFDKVAGHLQSALTYLFPPAGPLADLKNAQYWEAGTGVSFWLDLVPKLIKEWNVTDPRTFDYQFTRVPRNHTVLTQELEVQRAQESELQQLVEVMAAGRTRSETAFGVIRTVLTVAAGLMRV
jgi:hypothetical protein